MNRISTRLAISFLIVALLPTLPLSLVVQDLLERRFGPAIAEPLELALEAGLVESRQQLERLRSELDSRAIALARQNTVPAVVLLDSLGRETDLEELKAFLASRPDLISRSETWETPAPGTAAPSRRLGATLATVVNSTEGRRGVVLQPLPTGLVQRAGKLTEGMSLLRVLRSDKNRLVQSFVAPFLVIYGVLILVALAVGLVWSRSMVGPLERLVGATRKVGQGDLEFRLEHEGPGEVRELVSSFDTMVGRLAEQRRDLARLERAAAWRGMARTLAHEVKNPLTPILLAVNQARDRYQGDDEKYAELLNEVAEIVGEEVEKLRKLVREFGDFARMPRPEPRPGDLAELLNDLRQLYGDERLRVNGAEAAIQGWFDSDALRRALINLIDNGLAATTEAGREQPVQLLVHQAGEGGVRLIIRDEGAGIDPQNLDRIFEPDFTTKKGGMGLGLAVVTGIVAGHGGRLDVASRVGAGTTFTMDLPLTEPVAPAASEVDIAEERTS
jgi:two-component system nitrogen regulation sensor histidine kinase NtrY